MPLYLKHLLCAITAQGSGPAIRKKPTTLPRMQINPLRSCLYHAGRGLTRLLPISQCLIRLSHHCLPRDSHWRTFMPFTDTRFLVPERRSTIISIRVFLIKKHRFTPQGTLQMQAKKNWYKGQPGCKRIPYRTNLRGFSKIHSGKS